MPELSILNQYPGQAPKKQTLEEKLRERDRAMADLGNRFDPTHAGEHTLTPPKPKRSHAHDSSESKATHESCSPEPKRDRTRPISSRPKAVTAKDWGALTRAKNYRDSPILDDAFNARCHADGIKPADKLRMMKAEYVEANQ